MDAVEITWRSPFSKHPLWTTNMERKRKSMPNRSSKSTHTQRDRRYSSIKTESDEEEYFSTAQWFDYIQNWSFSKLVSFHIQCNLVFLKPFYTIQLPNGPLPPKHEQKHFFFNCSQTTLSLMGLNSDTLNINTTWTKYLSWGERSIVPLESP